MIFERTKEEVLTNISKGLFHYYCSYEKFSDNKNTENDYIFVASRNKPLYLKSKSDKELAVDSLINEYNRFSARNNLKFYSMLMPSSITIYIKKDDKSKYTGEIPVAFVKKIEKVINKTEKAVMISAVVHCHASNSSHIHVVWKYIPGKRYRNKVIENIDDLLEKGSF